MCYKELPPEYVFLEKIDLQNNKKQFWLVNGLSVLLGIVTVAIGYLISKPTLSIVTDDSTQSLIACAVLFVGCIVYMILHELTHGIFLYSFTKVKPKFGFVGWAAYCGNPAYCDKPRYAIVALAPLVVWGVAFGVLNAFFRTGVWFWVIWLLQTVNIGGAAGDLFVAWKLTRYPKEILVQDVGIAMSVYRKKTQEELLQERTEQDKEEKSI